MLNLSNHGFLSVQSLGSFNLIDLLVAITGRKKFPFDFGARLVCHAFVNTWTCEQEYKTTQEKCFCIKLMLIKR